MGDPGPVERFYDRWAGVYDVVSSGIPAVHAARRRAVDVLDPGPGDTVVEMGCGTGANLPLLREAVGETGCVVGIDLASGMLSLAERRIDRAGWENVHVVRADATRPPVARADAVLATFVVGMFEDPAGAVAGWLDLMAPGDRIALLDAVPRDRWTPLDLAFRVFVTLGTPPTGRIRYDVSPVDTLDERVEAARAELAERGDLLVDERRWLSFLRLTAGRKRGS